MTGVLTCAPQAEASTKHTESRAIAIVFDNSGSMYDEGDQAWCRATYAMEVFASMLNKGDILQIYPMWPIEVEGRTYTMENPLEITDASQAVKIRDIFTEDASGTPIESVDSAIAGLQKVNAEQKYLIVLTDGGTFSKNGNSLTKERTKKELDKRIEENAGKTMKVMYLGIGSSACMPNTAESDVFVKKQAVNTEDVLSTLTEMCNLVFGRDTLPKNHISGNSIDFDISMKKLIVFVQGEQISDLKVTGGSIGQLVSTQHTQYSTKGAGDYKSVPDTSLQGMMVTYENFPAGNYEIQYSGTARSVEVYYEPDADLDFVFTDSAGNTVDPNTLYEGEYKVSFGMKDGKTGQLIESDLLGSPRYQGSYSVDGKEVSFTHEGFSGSVDIPLKMGENFEAKLTATYLSGYTITKDSSDFGWPSGGIKVAARPAGEIRLEITGGQDEYSLQDLEESTPYTAKVYYQGQQLTGAELEKVELKWDPDTSNVEIMKEFADDHWDLSLHYKNPDAPQDTVCGKCTVTIYAFYSAQGSDESQGNSPLSYYIIDDFVPLQLDIHVPQNYIVVDELQESEAIVVNLKLNGERLSTRDFQSVELLVDCGGINYELIPNEQNSYYEIKLFETKGIELGNYQVKISAVYTDHIGRDTQIDDAVKITLSNIPLWLKWTIRILILLIVIALIWAIMHIKVLPTKAHTTKNLSSMSYDGDDVRGNANFIAECNKKGAKVQAKYAGKTFGVTMSVKPGKESYLYKAQKRRTAEVNPLTVRKFGPAKIQEVLIGSVKFVADETTGKLAPAIPNPKPFLLTHGMMVKYSGTVLDAGVNKEFEITSKLNFNKK